MKKLEGGAARGNECCKLANQRFGLEQLSRALLSDLGCCDETTDKIVKLAKQRDFIECSRLIEEVKNENPAIT